MTTSASWPFTLALLLLLCSTPARAADEPDELIPIDFAFGQPFRSLLLRVERPPGTFDLPNPSNDPTIEGGSLRVFDTGRQDDNTYDLPASGWSAVSGGYRYQGAGTYTDPCTRIDVEDDRIEVECHGPGVTVTSPFVGAFGVILSIGTDTKRYCARTFSLNDNGTRNFSVVNAPAPPACPSPPPVADRLEQGRLVVIRPAKLAKVIAEDHPTFDMPRLPGDDPLTVGASLRIFDTGAAAGDVTFAMPAAGWKAGLGVRGYSYRGAGTPSDPCTVRVAPRRLKAICRGSAVSLSPPFAGDAAVRLTIGAARYCMQFGEPTIANTPDRLIRKHASVAPGCASPGGAFLEVPDPIW